MLCKDNSLGALAVIAGGGQVPAQVVAAAQRQGREVVVIAIQGEADASLLPFEPVVLGWGQVGKMFNLLKKRQVKQVVLIGSVSKRPDFTQVLGDLGTVRRLPRILSALIGGDDSLLVKVMAIFEHEGFQVVGAHEIAPELLMSSGLLCGEQPSAQCFEDLAYGRQVIEKISESDIGQAVVVHNGRCLAVEAAEGTDMMLERCAILRECGRVKAKGSAGILIKGLKKGQDLRADLPTIGTRSIELAARAQLKGIYVEAGQVLLADKEELLSVCKKENLFLYGY
ncbi:LpxI family protein [Polycladidibacter stylochi]|uniref:LpxI family protein n=1 Tax=Polycladidibacter stylochi TaxID=1807766 RepID=UPI0008300133|nr:UDP-2,3-diacylglucosamine diphosphatase LpxI [Pseudovibrio stylochi]